jgi:hypothetical protein
MATAPDRSAFESHSPSAMTMLFHISAAMLVRELLMRTGFAEACDY